MTRRIPINTNPGLKPGAIDASTPLGFDHSDEIPHYILGYLGSPTRGLIILWYIRFPISRSPESDNLLNTKVACIQCKSGRDEILVAPGFN